MKKQRLVSLVCVAVLSQYGVPPITALAAENGESVVETTNTEDLTKDPILDNLPINSTEGTEEATSESESDSESIEDETTDSSTPEMGDEEAKTLNWDFKDSNKAISAGDEFTLTIKGTEPVAKVKLPDGLTYDAEKNAEELRSLINFDTVQRELTLGKIDEYQEFELVLTAEKAGDYELQITNEALETMGDKLVFNVAEKPVEGKDEEPEKEVDKTIENQENDNQKTKTESKSKIEAQSNQHSSIVLNLSSSPNDVIQSSNETITYNVSFGHNLSTDFLDNGKLKVTLENGVFDKTPSKGSNMESITMSYDKKSLEIILKDNWGAGNLDSISFSVKPMVGIQSGNSISLQAEFTGKFQKESNSFSNYATKDVLFDAVGIEDIQPGSTDWGISGWGSTTVYPGVAKEILGLLVKSNENSKQGFSNLRIKVHISDADKLSWFNRLFKTVGIYKTDGTNQELTLTDNQVKEIDEQTYIIEIGDINPEDVTRITLLANVLAPADTPPGESVSISAEYYNGDTKIFDVSPRTITVRDESTNLNIRYTRDAQGQELAAGQMFNTAVSVGSASSKVVDDLIVETEIPEEIQANKVVNGITSSKPSLKKVDYFDGFNWFDVTPEGNDFVFPNTAIIKKIRYHYNDIPTSAIAHQPFRTFYSVRNDSSTGTSFELSNSITFTDAKGVPQVVSSEPNTLNYEIIADKKEMATKVASYKNLSTGDFGTVNSGDVLTRSYRLAALTGEIDSPYIFVKVPSGITVKNKRNMIQYPYSNNYKTTYPNIGTPAYPISKANNVGSFQASDGDTVYYFKADDTKLVAADYLQMLLIENEYTIGHMLAGTYEVEVGMGSLNEEFTDQELNGFTKETLSTEMKTNLGANISSYYSDKTTVIVGQGERVNTNVSVMGSEDSDWKDSSKGEVGTVTPGKKVAYKISMKNDGSESYSEVELVNILPHVGDTLVSSSTSRGSEFQINPDSSGVKVLLNGQETNDVTLQYSLSKDPTRFSSPDGASIGSDPWVSSVSDFSQVRAVRVSLPTATLNPGDEITLEYSGVVVLDAKRPSNDTESFIANNSVAYKFKTQTNELRVGEPAVSSVKTTVAEDKGLISGKAYIDLDKDGSKTGTEPGLNQVRFELFKDNGSGNFISTGLISETSSDSLGNNGVFGFNDLKYGTYKVKVTLPSTAGAEFITAGTDKVEKINDTTAWVLKNGNSEFTINDSDSSSHEIKDLSVPLFVNTPLNGTISFKNKDGVVVSGDHGKGYTVELHKGSDEIATTTAKANGAYTFDGLTIDTKEDYKVKIIAPDGKSYVFTADNASGEITINMEPGIGTTDPTDLYITDNDNPTASVSLDNGHGTGNDINPDSVTLSASDATTGFSTAWKILKDDTVEYSGTSTDDSISLEDQVNYLIGDKKAGEYTVEMKVTDAAGNEATATKKFTIKFGTVTYMVGSTEYTKNENLLLYVDKLSKPADDPTKAGYVFDKWLTTDDLEWDFATGILSDEALSLKASFKAVEQTLTFDVNGGTAASKPEDIKGNTDSSVDLSSVAAPTRTGYTFKHWHKQGDSSKADVGSSITMPAGGITLVAEWEANSYKVAFDSNSGKGTMPEQNFVYGTDQELIENAFTRDGYRFDGWSTTKKGDVEYTNKESVKNLTDKVDGTVTLYAVWTATEQTVTFDLNGGESASKFPDIKQNTGTTVNLSGIAAPTKSGYIFKHWYKQGDTDKTNVGTSFEMPAGGLTLVAEWEANSYKVRFNSNDGTGTMSDQSFVYDTEQELNENSFTRNGYSFGGWSTTKNGGTAHADKASVKNLTTEADGIVTLYAVWNAIEQTITFDVNGGDVSTAPDKIKQGTGTTVDLSGIEAPTKSGYTFKHWYKQGDADKTDVGASFKMPAGGLTLVADWEANSYEVTFDINGGESTSQPDAISEDMDTVVDLSVVKVPKKTGYTFKHWYKQGDPTKADVGNSIKMPVNGITLVAEWEANSYKVAFDSNGGEGTMAAQSFKYDTAQNLTANSFTRDGYSFQGWAVSKTDAKKYDNNQSVKNLTTEKAVTVTLYAVWQAEEQTISFDVNGGASDSKPTDIKKVTDATVDLSSVEAPKKTGYTFKHWYKQGDTGKADVGSSVKMPAGGLTLVAEWEANSYKVAFDSNGGKGTMTAQNFKYDTAQSLTSNSFTRDGYSFQGWSTNKTGAYIYLDGAPVNNLTATQNDTVTLYAIWKADNQVLQFDVNGGNVNSKPDNINGDTDSTIDLSKIAAPTRTGYTFKHWYKQGDTDKANVGDSIKMPATGIILVAEWKANSYTVNFHKNNGTGTMTAQSFKYGESKKLTKNGFTRDGYTFVGWSTTADGASNYVDEATVSNLTDEEAGTIDLYAVWSASAQVIQFDVNGGDPSSTPRNVTGDTDDVIDLSGVADPMRTGYSFKHWYKQGDASKEAVGKTVKMPAKGLVLVAEWEANPYKVVFNANGGTETMDDQSFVYDTAQALTANRFKRAGYTFAGWSTTASGAVKYAEKATVKNLTAAANDTYELFAVWTADNQMIQFDVNGGDASSKPEDINAGTDSEVDMNAVHEPTRKGYTFSHWYKQGDTDKTQITGTVKMPVGGLTLVAEWTANKYTVKFDANEGSGAMPDQRFVYDVKQKLAVNTFVRTNYDFVGWSTTKAGAVEFTNEEELINLTDIKDGNQTLYAVWKLQERVISFDVNGGDLSTKPADIQKGIGEKIDLANVEAPTREGYTFDHWYNGDDATMAAVSGKIPMPDQDTVLVAAWKAHQYTVKFDASDGEGTMADQVFVYDTAQSLTANNFERKNHDFVGWATTKEGVIAHSDKETIMNLTAKNHETITLYAIWEKKPMVPVLKANNIVLTTDQVEAFMQENILDKKIAELSDAKVVDENTDDVIASHDKIIVDISNVKKKKGVYKAAVSYEAKTRSAMESKEIDVTVIEPSKKTQTITFDVNGGDTKTQPADINAPVGTTVSLKEVKNPTRSGYTFTGWFNEDTKVGETVEVPENGMKLVAHWSQNSGGGTNGTGASGNNRLADTRSSFSSRNASTTSNDKALPKTNDIASIGLSITGLMFVLLAFFGLKKKQDDESETDAK